MQILTFLLLLYYSPFINTEQWCERVKYQTNFTTRSSEVLPVLIVWYPVHEGTHSKLAVCSKLQGQYIQGKCSHNFQNQVATRFVQREELLDCTSIRNYCQPRSFTHFYLSTNREKTIHTNYWLEGHIGEYSGTKDMCLLENGLPLTQKCIYDAYKRQGIWENQNSGKNSTVNCLHDTDQRIVTNDLNKLYMEVSEQNRDPMQDNPKAADKLASILAKNYAERIAADLKISTNILKEITTTDRQPEMMTKVLAATDLLLKSNENVVSTSVKMNTPTQLIKTIDNYVNKVANVVMRNSNCSQIPSGVVKYTKDLVSVFYINPRCSNVSGIAFYNTQTNYAMKVLYGASSKKYYRYLYLNQSLEHIIQEGDIESAVYMPENVYKALLADIDTKVNMDTLAISLYRAPNFFTNGTTQAENVVLKLSIPKYKGELPGDVPLIFQRPLTNVTEQPQCANWDLGTWISTGFAKEFPKNLVLCNTRSTSSFGAILGLRHSHNVTKNIKILTVLMDIAQDLISIVGCCLSLFGLSCVWITAICFKEWRSQTSNKLLLNMCLVLTLLMSYFLFINLPGLRNRLVDIENVNHCIIQGAFLHYIILVLFLWMFFFAILQYQRYVTVIGIQRSAHFALNYTLTAWGVPLVPTALVIFWNKNAYVPLSKNTICYPRGQCLYMTVLLPISVISIANLAIFIYIFCSIRKSVNKFCDANERKSIIVQLRLSILLFFLLGISWLFGILAHMDTSQVLSTLFCLTSTIQGFVLFIYFVVVDKRTRSSWLKFCCGGQYYSFGENTTDIPIKTVNSSKKLSIE
ncbi:adhesion G-protein coupled receptor G2 [Stomoxys calcitrans]|uniref:adhesion G-protein coupled receptor G2 n=1 Tax=Stomoxys calcitrans TaxID=35570 RepID=UPI0027E392A4|nr:adhesion G-protein coupled receptor G2 [Stomoxys calcitrans]